MLSSARANVRTLLVFLTVLAIAVAACGGGGSNATNNGGGGGGSKATTPAGGNKATDNGGNGGGSVGDLKNAAAKYADINSFKFRMEMAGGYFKSLSGGQATGSSFVVEGTIVEKPAKAADVTVWGMHVIEIGDKQYLEMGGQWIESDQSGSSMADDWAPEKMFSGYGGYDWKSSGEETKNGVACVKYTVGASYMGTYAKALGVTGTAEWVVETWIAKNGGYPVSMTMTAKQGSDYAFKFIMDITNIHDPANKVVAPI